MIGTLGTLPSSRLAPMDYRYALNAARAILGNANDAVVICNIPALAKEVQQSFPHSAEMRPSTAALWVEPRVNTWRAELSRLASALTTHGVLAVVVSQPLARVLPECRTWERGALGSRLGGLVRLRRTIMRQGFIVQSLHGFHPLNVIAENVLSRQAERWGRPELGDRLHFAARLQYCVDGALTALSTVVLLVVRKS